MTDDAETPVDARELGRFRRGDVFRIYQLRPIAGGAELWRITKAPGPRTESIVETTFRGSEEALRFLEELDRTLRAEGWTAI